MNNNIEDKNTLEPNETKPEYREFKDPAETKEDIMDNNNVVNNTKKQYYDHKKKGFAEGNPGRPEGSKNKLTLLKERLAKYAEDKIKFETLPSIDILKLAVSLIPKEQKLEIEHKEPIHIEIRRYDKTTDTE